MDCCATEPAGVSVRRVAVIVGTRPQFVKAAALLRRLEDLRDGPSGSGLPVFLPVLTGQHYDARLSRDLAQELELPAPALTLDCGPELDAMTVAMCAGLPGLRPDLVLVFGDTRSALAGALAARQLGLPLAHVEAGTRSGEPGLPEEAIRKTIDAIATLHFCATSRCMAHLEREGLTGCGRKAVFTGDILLDSMSRHVGGALPGAQTLAGRVPVVTAGYVLATVHRQANCDDPVRLRIILDGLAELGCWTPVVWPVHPRAEAGLRQTGLSMPPNVFALPPLGYRAMLGLIRDSRLVLTDSGGVQREAFFLGVPALILRQATEWPETPLAGRALLVRPGEIVSAAYRVFRQTMRGLPDLSAFGDGDAAGRIIAGLTAWLAENPTRCVASLSPRPA